MTMEKLKKTMHFYLTKSKTKRKEREIDLEFCKTIYLGEFHIINAKKRSRWNFGFWQRPENVTTQFFFLFPFRNYI